MSSKIWYVYSQRKAVFVRLSQLDLENNDIICCKENGEFVKRNTDTVFVVTKAITEENPAFEVKPLIETVGKIANIYKDHGLYIRPSKLKKYIKENGDLDDDEVDANWYDISINGVAKEWYQYTAEHLNDILQKRISE
jgi:hypothetical protein